MKEELFKGLTEEQIAKAKTCKSQEEMLSLAKAEGVELNDEQLEAVNGGGCYDVPGIFCPSCHKETCWTISANDGTTGYNRRTFKCNSCGHVFKEGE